MPRLVDVHLGLGSHELTLNTDDPAVLDELRDGRHLLYYAGERLARAGVIKQLPHRSRIVGGPGLRYAWGSAQTGPTITDRTYLSGVSKLANGNFELEVPALLWAFQTDSKWGVVAGRADLAVGGEQYGFDVLQSQQVVDVEPGWTFSVWGTAARMFGTLGRLRLRATLTGQFPPQERMVNGSFEDGTTGWGTPFPGPIDIVTDAGAAHSGSNVLRLGPNNRPNLADETAQPNPSFETAATEPDQVAEGWVGTGSSPASENFERHAAAARGGSWGLRIVPPFEAADTDGTDVITYLEPISVVAGEEYSIGVYVRSGPESFNGEITVRGIFYYPSGRPAAPAVFWHPTSPTEEDDAIQIASIGKTANVWLPCGGTLQVPDGANELQLEIAASGIDGDTWSIDDVWCFARNTIWETVTTDDMLVETGRAYEASMWVRQDADGAGGIVRLAAILTGTDRPEHVEFVDITDSDDPEEARWTRISLNFTVPPGYTAARLVVACRNIDKGSWWVDEVSLKTTDTSTLEDLDSLLVWAEDHDSSADANARAITIPEGAEQLRLDWIAEGVGIAGDPATDGGGWRIIGTALYRDDLPISTIAEVFDDLCHDPEDPTIELLTPVTAPSGTIAFDKRWRDTHQRDALRELESRGLAGALLEDRVDPDFTAHLGTAETLYSDRTDIVLHGDMFEMIEPPDTVEDLQDLPTHVRVTGAEQTDRLGQKRTLTATVATGYSGVTKDGAPLTRTLVVQAAELELPSAVEAFAEYTAERQRLTPQATIRVSDLRHLGAMPIAGDWIYVADPESGLEDNAYIQALDDGHVVAPARRRIAEVEWTLGLEGSSRVVLLREDGTTLDISEHVDWEGENTATLVLGDPLPDFTSDPDGGPVGVQLLKWRQSVTR